MIFPGQLGGFFARRHVEVPGTIVQRLDSQTHSDVNLVALNIENIRDGIEHRRAQDPAFEPICDVSTDPITGRPVVSLKGSFAREGFDGKGTPIVTKEGETKVALVATTREDGQLQYVDSAKGIKTWMQAAVVINQLSNLYKIPPQDFTPS